MHGQKWEVVVVHIGWFEKKFKKFTCMPVLSEEVQNGSGYQEESAPFLCAFSTARRAAKCAHGL